MPDDTISTGSNGKQPQASFSKLTEEDKRHANDLYLFIRNSHIRDQKSTRAILLGLGMVIADTMVLAPLTTTVDDSLQWLFDQTKLFVEDIRKFYNK